MVQHKIIFGNRVPPTLCQQFVFFLFLFQHDDAPVQKETA